MIVVGLVGMQRVGKSEVAKVFQDKGYITIKISDLLTQITQRRGLSVTREVLRQITREDRQNRNGVVLDCLLSAIREQEEIGVKGVLIDGIRHPSEMEMLVQQDFKPHFLGVVADTVYTFDQQIRYRRLLGSADRPGFQNESWDSFCDHDALEWGSDDDPYGNQVGRCFELMRTSLSSRSRMLVNGEGAMSLARLHVGLTDYIQSIERQRRALERK